MDVAKNCLFMGRKPLRKNKRAGTDREERGWPRCSSPSPVHSHTSLGATISKGSQNCTQTSPRTSRTWGAWVCISRVYISWAEATHLPCPFYANRLSTGIFHCEKATGTIGRMSKQGAFLKSASCSGPSAAVSVIGFPSKGNSTSWTSFLLEPFLVGCSR